jgi:hypothetical protein
MLCRTDRSGGCNQTLSLHSPSPRAPYVIEFFSLSVAKLMALDRMSGCGQCTRSPSSCRMLHIY